MFCAQVNRLETTIHGMANASKALAECEQHFKSENAKEKSELLTAYKEKLAETDCSTRRRVKGKHEHGLMGYYLHVFFLSSVVATVGSTAI